MDFDHGRVLIKAGENQYSAEVVVGITDNGTAVFYDVVDIQPAHFQMQKEESPTDVTTNKSPDVIHGNSSEDTLPQQAAEVKGNVRYSARNQTESKEFKQWFGDWQNDPANASKVVNEDGTPKVMYHGTNAEFTVFDRAQGKKKVHLNVFGDGNYFTALREGASRYGANVVEAYLDIKNPYVKKDGFNTVADQIASEFGIARDSIKGSDVSSFLRQRGYDGRL